MLVFDQTNPVERAPEIEEPEPMSTLREPLEQAVRNLGEGTGEDFYDPGAEPIRLYFHYRLDRIKRPMNA